MKDWHLLLHDKRAAKSPATLSIFTLSPMPSLLSQSMVVDIHVCSYPFEERLCACAV